MAANFDGKSIQTDSIVDGPGLRAVIWTQGCSHNCEGCQNPGTHSFRGGEIVEIQKIKDELKELEYHHRLDESGIHAKLNQFPVISRPMAYAAGEIADGLQKICLSLCIFSANHVKFWVKVRLNMEIIPKKIKGNGFNDHTTARRI